MSWDPKWATTTGDISGRAVDVHDASGGFTLDAAAASAATNGAGVAAAPAKVGALAALPARLRGGVAAPRLRRAARHLGLRAVAPRAAAVW